MDTNSNGIAIIGLSGRYPGASNVLEFWQNLVNGVDSISDFSDEQLADAGLPVAQLRQDANWVTARGVLNRAEWFDASFFNIGVKEAEVTDPQHRIFLEASWEALEDAGYDPARIRGYVGVYAGMAHNSYFLNNLHSHPELIKLVGKTTISLGNEKDHLATRVAYKLNLKGPALSINTACSTSLVAVCQACQALLCYQCDLALAGGVAVRFPQIRANYHQEGATQSPDGRTRPFDVKAAGTSFSDGLGVVVLKRVAEAMRDGDQIYAVIKGVGVNNDGSAKVGFTAPSVEGQMEVVALAIGQAGFEPDTISYVEAHGTATPLGDPIEIAALTKAFRLRTARNSFCAIGSLKGNIGHADAAAGVAGLIKTALSLKHKTLPPSLHFTQPNPKIEFAGSPFYVNTTLRNWEAGPTPRRAGVSAFGFGGTNAHVVLEEAPAPPPAAPSRGCQLLLLSAKTGPALEVATANLLAHFKIHPDINLADAAFTLQVGRGAFAHRRMLISRDLTDAVAALGALDAKRVSTQHLEKRVQPVAFMFPGQGSQYVNMGVELYRQETTFKNEVDRCAQLLRPHLALDLREVLFPPADQIKAAEEQLLQTRYAQPALFVFAYALSKLWESWGIVPACMIGHSVGEYVAACLAEVFTLEDALRIVAKRAELVQAQPKGAMLAVRLAADKIQPFVQDPLSLAAINSTALCVVSGPFEAIDDLEARLQRQGVPARRLHTSHAFHSAMMEPVVEPLTALLQGITLRKPTKPFISNVTGRRISDQEATDPKYWASHLRQTVRFADGVGELLRDAEYLLLEVGPGQTLSPMARQQAGKTANATILSSFAAAQGNETAALLEALGRLWLAGQKVNWSAFYRHEKRQRITLPTYPFERKRYWVEPAPAADHKLEASDDQVNPDNMASATPAPDPSAGRLRLSTTETVAPGAGNGLMDSQEIASRQQRILATLRAQFQELSGTNLTEADASVTFMEMGLDSLLLAQASQLIGKRFGIQIAFRQMLEEVPTLDRLASFLDGKLPPGTAETEAQPAPVRPDTTPAPAPAPASLEALEAQLRTLTRQIELLRQAQSGKALAQAHVTGDHPVVSTDRLGTTALPAAPAPTPPSPATATKTQETITLPLSEPQMELWLASASSTEASCAYNQTFSVRVQSPLSPAVLCEVLQELVNRHDALRTTFLSDGSGQQIHSTLKLEVPVRDFASHELAAGKRKLAEATALEEHQPFDLANGPLLRAQLFRFSETHHVLLLTAHHLVLDGWSIGVLLRELSQLYSARMQRVPDELPPAMQYQDYLRWQTLPENCAQFTAAETYWLRQFANPPASIDLPTDRPRPGIKTYRADNRDLTLSPVLHASLKRAAAAQGCTLFTYLVASLNVWLHRLTGQTDLVVGFPAAGQSAMRNQGNHAGRFLVGHCVSFLPLRSNCESNLPFKEYLKEVGRQVLDAYDHQNYTFGYLVKKLNLPRDPSRTPLVTVVFNLSTVNRNLRLSDAELVFPPKAFEFFDLNIQATDSHESLHLNCRFNADLFEPTTIERWLGHWQCLLEGIIAHPNRCLSDLPMLTATEQQEMLIEWNQTQQEFPSNRCVHELFEDQVERAPEAVALEFEGRQLTYRQLNESANQLGHHLQTLGVGPDTLVAIQVDRSLEMVVGLLGILKAGGAYVPMDPNYPAERLAFMMADAQPKVLLTQQIVASSLPLSGAQTVQLDGHWTAASNQPSTNVGSRAKADNLAYVIYTSGSTGRPKGVLLEHRGLCNLAKAQAEQFRITPASRVLQFSSPSFDASVSEIFSALLAGATLVLARQQALLPGAELTRLLREQAISVATFPPSVLTALPTAEFPQLQTVVSAGEACTAEIIHRWSHGRRFINAYGPTESTVCATLTVCQGEASRVAIGRPIANTQIYILDRKLQPVPVGVEGELHIGGVGLARGYHHRAELTAERFIPNPFSSERGARLYKTGDLARYLPDGNIEYLGRIDHQVKVRGFRIELGEIETQLNRHPAVRESVVIVREDIPGDKRLAAYWTSDQVEPPADSELRKSLQTKLPEYMVPSAFVRLQRFPLTSNGKVNRQALPAPQASGSSPENRCILPRNALERAIAAIWQEVLRLDQVGVEDSFFNLGGHSLLLVQVQSKLQTAVGAPVTMLDLFRYPTISSLVEHLASQGKPSTPQVENGDQSRRTEEGKSRLNRRLKLSQRRHDGQVDAQGSEVTHE
jgi:amino acid adenylation domain-containing protein